jgi:hypothetical protein
MQQCAPVEQQQQLVHSPADVSQTTGARSSSGAADTWQQQQQQPPSETELLAGMDAVAEDSTEPIAENIFEEIDALLGDDPLNDMLDPVMGLEEQPLLLQASLQQVQQQLQQLEQLQHLQQQQQQPTQFAQLQLDVSSATCSGELQQQLQQQQLSPCSAQTPAAPAAAVFAKPRPLYRSYSACSSKSSKGRAAAADGLVRYGSHTPDQNKKRSRGHDPAAAAAGGAFFELPALKRQGSGKSSSSGGTLSGGDAWCHGWQQPVQQQQQHWQRQQQHWQQQQEAVGVDLVSQLPSWLTRQVSITASLASQSQ